MTGIRCYGRTENPCRGCSNRTIECHSTCEEYLEFLDIHEAELKVIRANKDKHSKFRTDYVTEAQFENRKKRNRHDW